MKFTTLLLLIATALVLGGRVNSRGQAPSPPPEASTGYDDQSNGFSDPDRRKADQKFFEEVEHISPDGLGPLYNAQSCRECHQTPVSGAGSQATELRVGHLDAHGLFQNPQIPINHGSEIIQGRTLVNDRAICPEVQEHVPQGENIRTTRLATNILGDGYVEAISDATLVNIRKQQCRASHGTICGQAVKVPVPESEGQDRIGRFGWKDQHASLLAFAADAYLNEMGITNGLQKTEVTTLCNPPVATPPNSDPTKVTEPNSLPDPADNNLEDIDHFASFMRSLKAPERDRKTEATAEVKHGAELFTKIGCAICHVETIMTGKSPAAPAGPGLHQEELEHRIIHPYSDFLLHDVGTGDGIAIALVEHFGRERLEKRWRDEASAAAEGMQPSGKLEDECSESYQTAVAEGEKKPKLSRDTLCARNKIRTAPLWG
ncbi:MAG: hypothetical protein JO159_08355, partial [Acidobacteria bacterium]|nr:hypothetical protein [Acidobacteriota bacterium]